MRRTLPPRPGRLFSTRSAWPLAPRAGRAALGRLLLALGLGPALVACGLATTVDLSQVAATQPAGDNAGGNGSTPGQALLLTGTLGKGGAGLGIQCTAQPRTGGSFTAVPQASTTAQADGNFSLALAQALNTFVSCQVTDANQQTLLAPFTFQGGGTSLDGNARMAHEVALAGNVDLGRIYYDDSTFEAAVDTDNITQVRLTDAQAAQGFAAVWSNFAAGTRAAGAQDAAIALDGVWQVQPLAGTQNLALPPLTQGACSANANTCLAELRTGDLWRLRTFVGQRLSDHTPVWALQAWTQINQPDSCGSGVGPQAAALAAADLNFTGQPGATDGFGYSGAVTFVNALDNNQSLTAVVDGLQIPYVSTFAADTLQSFASTLQVGQSTLAATGFGPDKNNYELFVTGDGCVDASTQLPTTTLPNASAWSTAALAGRCDITTQSDGLQTSRCTLKVNNKQLSCTAYQRQVNATTQQKLSGLQSFDAAGYQDANVLATKGSFCNAAASNTPAMALLQQSCYADFIHNSGIEDANQACIAQTFIDPTTASFGSGQAGITQDFRPKHLRVAELVQPLASTAAVTMTSRSRSVRPATVPIPQFAGTTQVACSVLITRTLTLLKVSNTQLLVTSTVQMGTDDTRPVCLANFAAGAERRVAYLQKQ